MESPLKIVVFNSVGFEAAEVVPARLEKQGIASSIVSLSDLGTVNKQHRRADYLQIVARDFKEAKEVLKKFKAKGSNEQKVLVYVTNYDHKVALDFAKKNRGRVVYVGEHMSRAVSHFIDSVAFMHKYGGVNRGHYSFSQYSPR